MMTAYCGKAIYIIYMITFLCIYVQEEIHYRFVSGSGGFSAFVLLLVVLFVISGLLS